VRLEPVFILKKTKISPRRTPQRTTREAVIPCFFFGGIMAWAWSALFVEAAVVGIGITCGFSAAAAATEVDVAGAGAPQLGHEAALSEICLPHSLHEISAMLGSLSWRAAACVLLVSGPGSLNVIPSRDSALRAAFVNIAR
jgi:hypothetical protein